MNNLIIIDGISGIWKENFFTYVNEKLANSTIIRKYSNRSLRNGENESRLDLHLLNTEFIDKNYDYSYSFNGHQYGILKDDIKQARTKDNVFIIVRNHDIIQKICNDFSDIYNVIVVFIYVGLELILQRYDSWYGDEGKKNLQEALIDYYRYPQTYKQILIYSENKSDFYRLMDNVVSHKNLIVDDFVFIVMSMADLGDKRDRKAKFARDLYRTIKESLNYCNLRALRIDSKETDNVVRPLQNYSVNTIDNKILNCIKLAKLVVVDLSFARPNCYFELGYALALNKTVIIVAHKKSEIHFDIEHHNIFKYDKFSELNAYLKNTVRAILK